MNFRIRLRLKAIKEAFLKFEWAAPRCPVCAADISKAAGYVCYSPDCPMCLGYSSPPPPMDFGAMR